MDFFNYYFFAMSNNQQLSCYAYAQNYTVGSTWRSLLGCGIKIAGTKLLLHLQLTLLNTCRIKTVCHNVGLLSGEIHCLHNLCWSLPDFSSSCSVSINKLLPVKVFNFSFILRKDELRAMIIFNDFYCVISTFLSNKKWRDQNNSWWFSYHE